MKERRRRSCRRASDVTAPAPPIGRRGEEFIYTLQAAGVDRHTSRTRRNPAAGGRTRTHDVGDEQMSGQKGSAILGALSDLLSPPFPTPRHTHCRNATSLVTICTTAPPFSYTSLFFIYVFLALGFCLRGSAEDEGKAPLTMFANVMVDRFRVVRMSDDLNVSHDKLDVVIARRTPSFVGRPLAVSLDIK